MDNNKNTIKLLEELKEMVGKPNHFVKKGKPSASLGGHFASKYAKKIALYQYIKISTIDNLIELYSNESEFGVQVKTEHDENVKTLFNRLNDMKKKNVLLLDIDETIKLDKNNVIHKLTSKTNNTLAVNGTKNMLTYNFSEGVKKSQEEGGVNHKQHLKNIREMLAKNSATKKTPSKDTPKRT